MASSIQKYIISLGTQLDKERIKHNCLPKGSYEIINGVTPEQVPGFVEAKFIKGRLSDERRGGLMGAFTAHFRAWEKIKADGDKGGIVLESDAQLLRNMACDIDDLPDSGITALGGNFRFKATDGYDNQAIFKWLGHVPKTLFSRPFQPEKDILPSKGNRWLEGCANHGEHDVPLRVEVC